MCRAWFGVGPGPYSLPDKRKTPAFPARVPWFRWSVRLAALVPRPSVPPGAGNQPKKALKPEAKGKKRAKDDLEAGRLDRDLDAATVRRHHDGDGSAVPTILIEQQTASETVCRG